MLTLFDEKRRRNLGFDKFEVKAMMWFVAKENRLRFEGKVMMWSISENLEICRWCGRSRRGEERRENLGQSKDENVTLLLSLPPPTSHPNTRWVWRRQNVFQVFPFLLLINLDWDTPLHHNFVVQIWLLCWNFFQFFLGCFRIGLNWIFNQHWIMVQISKCSQILEELEASPMGRMLV